MAVYLEDALFLDWETLELRRTHVRVARGEPLAFPAGLPRGGSPGARDRASAGDEVIPCDGRLVTRSFGCGHHHVYSALAVGMPPPRRVPATFHEVLRGVWWRLDRSLDRDMIEASAIATALAAVRCGVTLVIDHHSSPNAIPGSLETLAAAFERVGITCVPCYEMSDRDGTAARERGLEETDRFLASGRPGLVGLHASFTVGDELLRQAVLLAQRHRSGIHIHVAEDPIDQEMTQRSWGKRVVERLRDAGALASPKAILAHCLHLSPAEREAVADSVVWVAENAESNLNNSVGVPDAAGLGPRVMLGTDGLHSDMLRAAQFTYLAARAKSTPEPRALYERFRAVHRYAAAAGFPGDDPDNLVVLDYPTRTGITRENFFSHFLFGLTSAAVRTVIARGRVVLRDREVVTLDEQEALARAREQAGRLWHAMEREG
jgi:cytosine/adenosine deaminase-related metal-dependent hydrolase